MQYRPSAAPVSFVFEPASAPMTFGGRGASSGARSARSADEARARIRTALEPGSTFRHRRRLFRGTVRRDHWRGARGAGRAARRGRDRDQGVRADRRRPERRGRPRQHILSGVKASLKRLGIDHIDLFTRFTAPIRSRRSRKPWTRSICWSRGAGPLCRRLELGRVADRQGPEHRRAARFRPGHRRRCRPTTRSPAAIRAGDRCRCWPPEGVRADGLSPLAGGLLSGKYDGDGPPPTAGRISASRRSSAAASPAVLAALLEVAERQNVASRWRGPAAASAGGDHVIIGANRPEQLSDNIAAAEVRLARRSRRAGRRKALPAEYPG